MGSSIAQIHPELLSEWSDRNTVSPDEISYGSNTMLWWKGACGHEWQASAKSRSAGEGCPICANKRIVPGINDLASRCPELMKEWSDRNVLDPTAVSPESHKKAWWKDNLGHEWETEIRYRAIHGTGCPYCSHNKLKAGFNDLLTVSPDTAREWSVRNKDLLPNMVMAYASKKVWWKCSRCGHEWKARVADRTRGHGCPSCSGATVSSGIGDLRTLYPEIARDWSEKNEDMTADTVSPKSRKAVWWRCSKCGYEWRSTIYARVCGARCPQCANTVVTPGHNDLATTDPEVLKEWDYELNTEDPKALSRRSQKVVKWKCGYGHQYRMKISDRTIHGRNCPCCEREFLISLPRLAVMYYAGRVKLKVLVDSADAIGLHLDAYVPALDLAFDIVSKNEKENDKTRRVKRYLCDAKGIMLTEFREDSLTNPIAVLRGVKEAFKAVNVFVSSSEVDDLEIIRNTFYKLKEEKRTRRSIDNA